jgi:hypothetical protein
LLQQGVVTDRVRGLLDDLVREHIQRHGGDVEKSLAAAGSKDLAGAEITSGFLPKLPDLLATMSMAAGTPRDLPGEPVREATEPRLAGGRFRVGDLHAKGGLGQVMKALDEELSRTVAVKEIQARFADDPASQERFVFEAEITGGLEHPSIVPVYGLGKYPDGRPYYAMRFIRGEDFLAAIQRFHGTERPNWDASRRNEHLKLKAGRSLDYETEASVTLSVTATDSGTPPLALTRQVVIAVVNADEPPSSITLDGTVVSENAPGAVIGDLRVSDPGVRHIQGRGHWGSIDVGGYVDDGGRVAGMAAFRRDGRSVQRLAVAGRRRGDRGASDRDGHARSGRGGHVYADCRTGPAPVAESGTGGRCEDGRKRRRRGCSVRCLAGDQSHQRAGVRGLA